MILVPEINIWTPEWEWPEWMKRRKDKIVVATAVYGGAAAPVITISGETGISSFDTTASPWQSTSGIRVNDDGTIDKITTIGGGGQVYTQIDGSTDWIIPNGDASSSYQFQLGVTLQAPNYLSDANTTWIAMGSGSQSASYLIWRRRKTNAGLTNWSWVLFVRLGTGSIIDSATYAGNNENGVL